MKKKLIQNLILGERTEITMNSAMTAVLHQEMHRLEKNPNQKKSNHE